VNTRAIVIGGIAAGLVIASREMIVEALLPGGAGFFGPPMWGAVLGLLWARVGTADRPYALRRA